MKTSCLYCVNPDCAGAGIDNPSTQLITACALFLDPRKELVRVREESAVYKLASETLHSELVRVTARVERLAEALRGLLACFGNDLNVHEEFQDQLSVAVENAEAALAEQPAEESKPASPAGGK